MPREGDSQNTSTGEVAATEATPSKRQTDKNFKRKANSLRKKLIKNSDRDVLKKKTKKKKGKKALLNKEGQNAAADEPRRGAAAVITKNVVSKGELTELEKKAINERFAKLERKMKRAGTTHELVHARGQVIVVADQPPPQVRHISDFVEEDKVAIARYFNFDRGEEVKYLYLNEHIPFGQRVKKMLDPVAKVLSVHEKEDFFKPGHAFILLSNKNLYQTVAASKLKRTKQMKKIALQNISKVDVLPGSRKGHETTVKFSFYVDAEEKKTPTTPRPSTTASPSSVKTKQAEKVLEVHFHRDQAASFFVAKIMSFLERKENILLRTLKVRTVEKQRYRKGAPERKATDLTDVKAHGWLEVQAKDKWKKQYFVLASEWLYYYSHDKAEKQSGFIDLVPDECVIVLDGPQFTISTLAPPETGSNRSPSLRTFSIRAVSDKKSMDDTKKWAVTLIGHTKQLKKRLNLGNLALVRTGVAEEPSRERLTKHMLEFVKGDRKTGPLSAVCREWRDWFHGREMRKEFPHTPKLVIDMGCSVWRAGLANMDKVQPDILLPIAPYSDDDFRQVHKPRLEASFKTLFTELSINPEDCYCLVTKPLRAHKDWEKTVKHILFDSFQFRACAVVDIASAVGEACELVDIKTFLLCDVGSRGGRIVPVVEGHVLEAKSNEFPHLSQDGPINEILSWICPRATSLKLNPSQATELARLIKEKYVTCDEANKRNYEAHVEKYKDRTMTKIEEMADAEECFIGGRKFKIPKHVLYKAGELLFRPKEIIGDEDDSLISIQEAVWNIAESAEKDNVAPLISRIVVTGGGANIKGFKQRLVKELDLLIAKKRQGQGEVEESDEEEEDEEKAAAREIEEDIKSRKGKVVEKLKVQPFVETFNIPDQADLVWFGANYCADNQKCQNEKFWTANPAHPELDIEEEDEAEAQDVEDDEEEEEEEE